MKKINNEGQSQKGMKIVNFSRGNKVKYVKERRQEVTKIVESWKGGSRERRKRKIAVEQVKSVCVAN